MPTPGMACFFSASRSSGRTGSPEAVAGVRTRSIGTHSGSRTINGTAGKEARTLSAAIGYREELDRSEEAGWVEWEWVPGRGSGRVFPDWDPGCPERVAREAWSEGLDCLWA